MLRSTIVSPKTRAVFPQPKRFATSRALPMSSWRRIDLVLGGAGLIIGAGGLLTSVPEFRSVWHTGTLAKASTGWTPGVGVVEKFERHANNRVEVKYTYEQGNKVYTGDHIKFVPATVPHKLSNEEVAALEDLLKPGRKVKVFYDPKNPSKSVLTRGNDMGAKDYVNASISVIFYTGIFCIGGLYMFRYMRSSGKTLSQGAATIAHNLESKAQHASEAVSETMPQAKAKAESLVDQAKTVAQNAKEQVASTAQQAKNATVNKAEAVSEAMPEAKAKAESLVDQAKSAAQNVKDQVVSAAQQAKSTVESKAQQVKSAANEAQSTAADAAQQTKSTAQQTAAQAKDTSQQAKNVAEEKVAQAKSTAEQLKSAGQEKLNEASAQARAVKDEATAQASPVIDKMKKMGENVVEKVADKVEELAHKTKDAINNNKK